MQVKSHWFWLLVIPVLVSVFSVPATSAQVDQREYFSQTGHWVLGDFLIAYQSAANPELLYGMPITDEFVSDVSGGRRVQYFEYARFELRPENPPELRVVKSPLGTILYDQEKSGEPLPVAQGPAGCRLFKETGFQVCTAFLDFFDAYGGIDQFGYPISEPEEHDAFSVQYFQFARMEWHPELNQVVLTDVGKRYFTMFEDPRRAQPVTNGAPHVIMDLQVQAYVSQPVMLANGDQTVFVVVQDQSLAPVAGAQVSIALRPASMSASSFGNAVVVPVGTTDSMGIAKVTFPMYNQANGLVEIVVTASYNNLKNKTITSYRVWW